MIVYNSMLLVVIILMMIYKTQVPDPRIRHSQPIPWAYAIISMGYIIFFAALRSGFADTRAYIFAYENIETGVGAALQQLNAGGKAPGWGFIQILFKTYVSTDFHWWLSAIAILSGIPIMLTLRRTSVDYLFSIFLFVASTSFSWMLNGIRQFVVAAILFGCYNLLVGRKRLLFIAAVLLCSLIHTSAIILLPAILLIDYKPFGKMMTTFVVCIMLSSFFVSQLIDTMDLLLKNSAYHGNIDQFVEDDGANPLRVLFESAPVILAFIKRKQIAALNNSFLNMCVNMSTVSAGLFFTSMLTSGIMIGRLPIYYGLYNLILIPFLINFVYTKQRQLLYFCFFVFYIIFYFFATTHFYYISDILGNYF